MLLMTLAALVALGQAAPLTKAEQLQEAAGKGDRVMSPVAPGLIAKIGCTPR